MMNCQETQQQFDNYLDHQLDETLQAAFHLHLAECSDCREALNSEKHFRATLAQLPVEPMSPAFAARALRNARSGQRPALVPLISGAIAASFLLLFSFVFLFQGAPTDSITVALLEEREVTLAFNSPQPIQQASFEIQLPEGVEIRGYPGKQVLAWNGSLKNGQNILQLPIIVRSGNGGALKAVIHHQDQHKSFSINIKVAERNMSQQPVTIYQTTTI